MSIEHTLFKLHKLHPPPQWNCHTEIGAGGFAKVFLETITHPAFGTQLCAVKRIIKDDAKFSQELYMREIEIFSKLKQVGIAPKPYESTCKSMLLAQCVGRFGSTKPQVSIFIYIWALANLSRIYHSDWLVRAILCLALRRSEYLYCHGVYGMGRSSKLHRFWVG